MPLLRKFWIYMCGFLFAFSPVKSVDPGTFNRARDCLAHRGPDDAGSAFLRDGQIALGHRRLSILDLSIHGHQPMYGEGIWALYNGEIYNYPELKRQLEQLGCVFRSHCDTEILLHGYRVWGKQLPKRLIGMFSFCLWDEHSDTLFAARDHTGQKPFYYYRDGNCFVAASEPKAIFSLLGDRPPMRRESIKEYLIYNDIPDPHTWYENLSTLAGGHSLTLLCQSGVNVPHVEEYWTFRPPESVPRKVNFASACDELGDLVRRSVAMHQLADVEVGAFLSGGLDSGGVVAVTSGQRRNPLKTFSVGYDNDEGELPLARQIASSYGCTHAEMNLGSQAMLDAIERSANLFDMPFGDNSQFPTYEVARLAARQVKVVLTGDGGDEAFGGYDHMNQYMGRAPMEFSSLRDGLYSIRHWRARTRKFQSSLNFFYACETNQKVDSILGPTFSDLQSHDGWASYKKHWYPELHPFRRAQWNDLKCFLPMVLKKVDRCTMAHSLEARSPFLFPELIEYMFKLPVEVSNIKGMLKYLYRQWLSRHNLLPESILTAPKIGFSVSSLVATSAAVKLSLSNRVDFLRDIGWIADAGVKMAERDWMTSWRIAMLSGFASEARM
jgi:asparagine synthase (glutamine-hydrolysing)